jgi:hypothetical protein
MEEATGLHKGDILSLKYRRLAAGWLIEPASERDGGRMIIPQVRTPNDLSKQRWGS